MATARSWVVDALTAAILLGALTAGCADDGVQGDGPSSSSTSAPAPEVLGLFGPIDSFLYEGSDPIRLELGVRRAVSDATAACMRDLGWTYQSDTVDETQVRRDLIINSTSSALAEDEFREQWGYGLTRSLVDPTLPREGEPGNAAYYESLSLAEQDTYDLQLTGCLTRANAEVGLDDVRWQEFGRLQEDLLAQIMAEADLDAASDRWVDCMAERGFGFSAIPDAPLSLETEAMELYGASLPDPAAVSALHQREITQAAEDWECQRTTTVAAWTSARNRVERDFVEEQVGLMTELRESLQKASHGP